MPLEATQGQIVALGGGGFSMEPDNPLLDDFILSLSQRQPARVCFVMKGAVLCGVSAGMICWFRGVVTDSIGALDALSDGLGLIDAAACPHYDGEEHRRPTYQRLIEEGFGAGYGADDGAALHFRGTDLVEAVSSRLEASAYRVELVQGRVKETRLETRFLG